MNDRCNAVYLGLDSQGNEIWLQQLCTNKLQCVWSETLEFCVVSSRVCGSTTIFDYWSEVCLPPIATIPTSMNIVFNEHSELKSN